MAMLFYAVVNKWEMTVLPTFVTTTLYLSYNQQGRTDVVPRGCGTTFLR